VEEKPKKVEPEPPMKVKEVSAGVREMEKISTYNGDTTEKYAWS
jgi:hypothetical protein